MLLNVNNQVHSFQVQIYAPSFQWFSIFISSTCDLRELILGHENVGFHISLNILSALFVLASYSLSVGMLPTQLRGEQKN